MISAPLCQTRATPPRDEVPYGRPAQVIEVEQRRPQNASGQGARWANVVCVDGVHYTFLAAEPLPIGLWYVRVRDRHDSDRSVHLLGGYATPAALMDALAGSVVWGEP